MCHTKRVASFVPSGSGLCKAMTGPSTSRDIYLIPSSSVGAVPTPRYCPVMIHSFNAAVSTARLHHGRIRQTLLPACATPTSLVVVCSSGTVPVGDARLPRSIHPFPSGRIGERASSCSRSYRVDRGCEDPQKHLVFCRFGEKSMFRHLFSLIVGHRPSHMRR